MIFPKNHAKMDLVFFLPRVSPWAMLCRAFSTLISSPKYCKTVTYNLL